MSRFIGVVIDMIVGGAKETEKTLDSVGQKLGSIQGAIGKVRAAAGAALGAVSASLGIVKLIDEFSNRTEYAKKKLDEITVSARTFAETTLLGFGKGDDFDKRIQAIAQASQKAIDEASKQSQEQLTGYWNVARRNVGLGPSRAEIEKAYSEAANISNMAMLRGIREIEKLRTESEKQAARKVADARAKEDERVFGERRQQELQLLADEAALQEDSEKKKIEIQIQFARQRIELEKQLEKEKDDYLHKLLEARYELTFETERRQQAELIQERERLEKESAKRVAEAHAKAMEDAMAPILQRIETARTQTNTALLQSLSALNTNLQLFANSFKPGGSNAPARSIWQ